jgi:hypothetical protein
LANDYDKHLAARLDVRPQDASLGFLDVKRDTIFNSNNPPFLAPDARETVGTTRANSPAAAYKKARFVGAGGGSPMSKVSGSCIRCLAR